MASQQFIQTVRGRNKTEFSDSFALAASTYVPATSGRYVTSDGTASQGYYALTTATDTRIDGWLNPCYKIDHNGTYAYNSYDPYVGSSTAGETVVSGTKQIHSDNDAVWMPASTTLAGTSLAYLGKLCDLAVSGSTTTTAQKAVIATDTYHHVRILEMNLKDNLLLVYANV